MGFHSSPQFSTMSDSQIPTTPTDSKPPSTHHEPAIETESQPNTPPDGGAAAWLVVLGAWCCSFSSLGWINSMGSFQQYYQIGPLHEYPTSTIAWIPSLQLFFLFALGPIAGILFDNYGPRPLVIGGTFLHVFGLMMASLGWRYAHFLVAQGVVSAVGVACLFTPALACISTWFSKRRALALSTLSTGASSGGVVFPIVVSRMIETIGFPWTMRTCALIILGLQFIAIFAVRSRTPPVSSEISAGRLSAPFREFPFLLLLFGVFVMTFGAYVPIVYIAVQGFQEAHMSNEMAQHLVAIYNASSLIGRLIAGYTADKLGRWNMFIICSMLSSLSIWALWFPAKSQPIAIGFAIMFGCTSGAFIGLSSTLPISVCPLPEYGYRMGIFWLSISLPALALSPVGGAILQSSKNGWLDLKIFSGVMCLVGSVIVLLSRLLYTKRKILTVF
ncbi:hypothetical protein HYFRA_00012590 [Hymenoscyphus fraxineus]|uniref:Major facilitator superfamily (MFS) profile domain-containing protein n=1 Tax=Hymenoscyphus fraxineus TaxID=746836 RepID=A0A9N9L954_9HELO|nr:hypothetical protein HYFRA_00012590 [Hymenoscyphus fraxineus]